MKRVVLMLACLLLPAPAVAADTAFDRPGVVKLLGYDPETIDVCKSYNRRVLPDMITPENTMEVFLRMIGEDAAERAVCPKHAKPKTTTAPTGESMSASSCLAVASAAGGPITEHISQIMGTDHPDVVAAYAEGVAKVLSTFRDRCTAHKDAWAKVATQALLFENRAASIRASKSCTLWRLAVSKELKAAEDIGKSKGKAAGLKHLDERAGAALFGAKHYCGEDTADGVVDANFTLTKMLLDSMPDK